MGRRLTLRQKAKNKTAYKFIRNVWEERGKGKLTYKEFKAFVVQYSKGTGKSIKEATKIVSNKYHLGPNVQGLKSYKEQAKENLLTGMKSKFRATYDELRRKAGKFAKGEHLIDRIEYDAKENAYILTSSTGDQYAIREDQSPKWVYLQKI